MTVKDIFGIALGNVEAHLVCTQAPRRVKETATFVIDCKRTKVLHPFDLEADDVPGASENSTKVRFYRVDWGDDGEMMVSTEVTPKKDKSGKVICGHVKEREGSH